METEKACFYFLERSWPLSVMWFTGVHFVTWVSHSNVQRNARERLLHGLLESVQHNVGRLLLQVFQLGRQFLQRNWRCYRMRLAGRERWEMQCNMLVASYRPSIGSAADDSSQMLTKEPPQLFLKRQVRILCLIFSLDLILFRRCYRTFFP